jgi:predicted nucleotide-binding protein (sugar kinase/HSP70/actin superfamily)
LDASSTPHFLFHDLDQNKPGATFKIRIESIDYFLKQEEELLKKRIAKMGQKG